MEYKSNETHIKEHFGDMMTINAFSMNNSPVGLIEQKTFDYKKHFVDFFEYMANHCSTKNTEYTNANYLRKKIDEFGEKFRTDYYNAFSKSAFKKLVESSEETKIQKADDMKKKFCGNLLEIINGLYAIEFEIVQGFVFDKWCNNSNDDFMGVDGILKQRSDENVKIPINTKHSFYNEISKFAPFQKLGNWMWMQAGQMDNDEDKLSMINLACYGVIFTDNDTSNWSFTNFPKICVINDEIIRDKLGKKGNVPGCVDMWEHWYNIVK